jgi:outer membrane protein OmpA-like peptidoglycan-associated protein
MEGMIFLRSKEGKEDGKGLRMLASPLIRVMMTFTLPGIRFSGQKVFFTSNRDGVNGLFSDHCCDDIFTYYDKDYISLGVRGTVFNVTVNRDENYTKEDREPLEEAEVILYRMVEDEDNEEKEVMVEIISDTTDNLGHYFLDLEKSENYRLMFKKDGYFYRQIDLSTMDKTRSDTFEFNQVFLEEISTKPKVFYIYYAFDDWKLDEDARNTIDTTLYAIMEETPDIIVEITSHTDSQGDSLYNEELSEKRAKGVVDYLINKGIEKGRLRSVGKGERVPIADNDTEEGRALNRRTEFSVIGSIDPFSKLNVSRMKIITKEEQELLELEEDDEGSE